MDKYAVVTEDKPLDGGKKHASVVTCPVCNEEILVDSNVLKCPEHGTAPFEDLG